MVRFIKASIVAFTAMISIAAQATLISNGSFEANDVDSINNNGRASWEVFEVIDGWTTVSGAGIEIQTNDTLKKIDTPFGDQYVELDSHNVFGTGADTNSLMMQTINGLTVGSYYELSYFYMPRTSKANDNGINVFGGPMAMSSATAPSMKQQLTVNTTAPSAGRKLPLHC